MSFKRGRGGKRAALRSRVKRERAQNTRAMQGLTKLARMTEEEARLYVAEQQRRAAYGRAEL